MDKLKENIESLSNKAIEAKNADDAMKFAQAALNTAHAYATVANTEKHSK